MLKYFDYLKKEYNFLQELDDASKQSRITTSLLKPLRQNAFIRLFVDKIKKIIVNKK
ncbi:TPA: hypothetical protein RZJ77_000163 [Campylobacter coli]|nr:hypothetical protein [Campylobacter coli]